MALVRTCPTCERRTDAAHTLCDYCGTSLENAEVVEASALTPPRLTIDHHHVDVPLQTELLIGRADLAQGWTPDVDLQPFGGTSAAGVSRRHSKLVWQGSWYIQDLESHNGTYLNSKRLMPGQLFPLHSGAVIRIGKLYIVFQG